MSDPKQNELETIVKRDLPGWRLAGAPAALDFSAPRSTEPDAESPDLFALARERAGRWPAEHTVAVGDTPLDVSSSRGAGCRCVAVTTGRYDRDELGEADAVIADLAELESTLAALN